MTSGNHRRLPLTRRLLALSLALAGGVVLLGSAAPAQAQTPAAVRIAVVNPAKVFALMDEKRAVQEQMDTEKKKLEESLKAQALAIQAKVKKRDDELKPGTTQYEEATNEIYGETAKYKVMTETEKLKADLNYKRHVKVLFDKIQAATGEVATRDGIDLVLTDYNERLPDDLERVDSRVLQQLLAQRNVMFVAPKPGMDITDAVILLVNAKYKQAGGVAPPPLINQR